jgi:parallel beta-helix repeat protein
MKKNILIIIKIVILFLILSINSSIAIDSVNKYSETSFGGNIFYVGGIGPENYSIIQEAIDDAFDGDTIFVFNDSSPYIENILIKKSINLIGEDLESTVIDGKENRKNIIYIMADCNNIRGFTIKNGTSGIKINSNNNTIIGNLIIDNIRGGVVVENSKYNIITENRIINNFYGIQLYEKSHYNLISNNLIRKSYWTGLMIGNPIVPLFLINKNYDLAIGFDNSSLNTIEKNTLMNPTSNAVFYECKTNFWDGNYWGRPRIFPKIIRGLDEFDKKCINIDWHPAFLPYHKLF